MAGVEDLLGQCVVRSLRNEVSITHVPISRSLIVELLYSLVDLIELVVQFLPLDKILRLRHWIVLIQIELA